jgi:hypothetical protein
MPESIICILRYELLWNDLALCPWAFTILLHLVAFVHHVLIS